jgi:hypothetical protein
MDPVMGKLKKKRERTSTVVTSIMTARKKTPTPLISLVNEKLTDSRRSAILVSHIL